MLDAIRYMRDSRPGQLPLAGIEFVGNFSSWEEAVKQSSGYGAVQILEKVKAATAKVRDGEAAFERDSVTFEKPEYPFPLIAILLRAAMENDGCLTVLDFGGALGSSYYQCRDFLSGIKRLRWCVVEQPHFVQCGQENFQQDELSFFDSIEDCVKQAKPNLVLMSSVLQYMEKPGELLDTIAEIEAEYVVIDRTPFPVTGEERLAVQIVPASLYQASYPIWLFGAETILAHMQGRYSLLAQFDALDGIIGKGDNRARFKGQIFRKHRQGI